MKNNSRRKKKSHFDRNNLFEKGTNEKFDKLLHRKATPEQLEAIRYKVKTEKKKTLVKTAVFTLVLIALLVTAISILF